MKHEPILLTETEKNIPIWRIIGHSRFNFLTSVNIGMGLIQIIRETLSAPKPKKALVLVCINKTKKIETALFLGSTPRYSRPKFMPSR